ncbi:DUF5776 domain-containing protein [Levilactobacillus cerevisiae]|uniref:DUF5776 domain-containing protein n=1 Tax=Levilactobacillus cerevisiae TaxID=1704076 RepID=UPI000F78F129|nr:DUF5776 domain-containing protein [Levilactobacillus cerevisiae]
MKMVKGLLAVAVAVGVGMAWNGEGVVSNDKYSLTSTSVLQAEASEVSAVNLQAVDEAGNAIMDDLNIQLDNVEVGADDTYAEVLAKVAQANGVDYVEALKYFSLVNNNDDGFNRKLFSSQLNQSVEKNYGSKTLTEAQKLKLAKGVSGKYTLDIQALHKNLDQNISDGKIQVPFKQSNTKTKVAVSTFVGGKEVSGGSYNYSGVEGDVISLENSQLVLSHTHHRDAPVFTISNETQAVRYLPLYARKATVTYNLPDGVQGPASQTFYGLKDEERTVVAPTIAGYTVEDPQTIDFNKSKLDRNITFNYEAVNIEEPGDGDNNGNNPGGGDNNGDNNGGDTDNGDNNGNGGTTAVTPFKVYGKQRLYRYSHATFTNNRRVQTHAKKTKAYAPVMTVVGTTQSNNGVARYTLDDGTHITANSDYVAKLYWLSNYKKLYVTNPNGINTHKGSGLNSKVAHVKQGSAVTVKAVTKKGEMTRYQLANGTYITGNKQFVSPTKPKNVTKVKAKTTVRVYKDVNLTKVAKTYKKGSTLNVQGWDHSRGDVHHVSGVKRYKVAGGYMTANSKYVQTVNTK